MRSKKSSTRVRRSQHTTILSEQARRYSEPAASGGTEPGKIIIFGWTGEPFIAPAHPDRGTYRGPLTTCALMGEDVGGDHVLNR